MPINVVFQWKLELSNDLHIITFIDCVFQWRYMLLIYLHCI